MTDDLAHEICLRADGLPLAVELVAAGARILEPRVLVDHLKSLLVHEPAESETRFRLLERAS